MILVCLPCRDFQTETTVLRDGLGNPFCFGCGREMLPYYTASESAAPTSREMEDMLRKQLGWEGQHDGRIIDPRGVRATAQDNKD